MTQPNLFDLPDTRYKFDPEPLSKTQRQARINKQPKLHTLTGDNQKDTSRQAAIKARPRMKGIKQQIISLLEEHPKGLTCSEFCQITNREKPSCSPRFCELEEAGLIYVSGTRPSNTGSQASVYKLKTNGE